MYQERERTWPEKQQMEKFLLKAQTKNNVLVDIFF